MCTRSLVESVLLWSVRQYASYIQHVYNFIVTLSGSIICSQLGSLIISNGLCAHSQTSYCSGADTCTRSVPLFSIVNNQQQCGLHTIIASCFQQPVATHNFVPCNAVQNAHQPEVRRIYVNTRLCLKSV